jgi:hypothetical protein
MDVLHRQRLVEPETMQRGGMHSRIDTALAHHHFDGVARNQVNQRERKDGDADERRYHHADAAQNKAEHGSSLWSW